MRRFAIALVLVAACGSKKPDRDKARAACAHVLELTWDKKKGPIDPEAIESCTADLHHGASAAQVDCLLAAKTAHSLDACGEGF